MIHYILDETRQASPEVNANFVSKMFFAWFNGIIYNGWKRHLKADDLYDLNQDDLSRNIVPVWERNWEKQRRKNIRKAQIPTQIHMSIIPTILQTFGSSFAVATFLRFVGLVMQMVRQPISFIAIFFKLIGYPSKN